MARPLIFWVEDNPNDVLLLRQALAEARMDVEIIVPDNAVAAFRFMEGKGSFRHAKPVPDLILIDINLPVIKGTVVLEEAHRHPPWKSVPIVVLTSSSNEKELQGCRKLGAVACITKPATFDGYRAVAERLRQYLPRSGGHTTIVPTNDSPDDRPTSDLFPVPRLHLSGPRR
jgi:CheY-like chemotaxis protein